MEAQLLSQSNAGTGCLPHPIRLTRAETKLLEASLLIESTPLAATTLRACIPFFVRLDCPGLR